MGYEINKEYIQKIREKLNVLQADLEGTEYIFQEDYLRDDLENAIRKLPYIFTDPHKLDKKIDPKKLQFGSKIDRNNDERETYYSIKQIISPELVRLNNDLVVRLLGVKKKENKIKEAIKFLYNITKGQKVFLKFDGQKYDENNELLCYLYLKNKTFINSHLIKKGLANVNKSANFKYKDKFIKMELQNA